ncbi:MAG: Hsp20/alpha crystallin family protein [Thermomicrobiales bacterium]
MSISRWDPWRDMMSLRDAMDRLIAESFVPMRGEKANVAAPLSVDMAEKGDDFVVTAPVPGVSPDDVEITVLGDTLRIRGERRESKEHADDGNRWIMREQHYGMFERTVRLPSSVKPEGAKAEFRDGMLTISLPKTEEAKERRIPVSGGTGRQGQRAEEIPVETGEGKRSRGEQTVH